MVANYDNFEAKLKPQLNLDSVDSGKTLSSSMKTISPDSDSPISQVRTDPIGIQSSTDEPGQTHSVSTPHPGL